MGKHPDKIFRNKLENYQRNVPASAWDRIEGNLQSKHDLRKWWKYAAAILVVVVAGFMVYQNGSVDQVENSGRDTVAEQPSPNREAPQTPVKTPVSDTTEVAPKSNDVAHVEVKPSIKKQSLNKQLARPATNEDVAQQSITSKAEEVSISLAPNVEVVDEQVSVTKNSYATIVYSKEEVDNRFLRKKPAEKKSIDKPVRKPSEHTGLASNSKSKNQSIGLGDLRQLKDEFFSFGFLAQNDKTQKSKIQ